MSDELLLAIRARAMNAALRTDEARTLATDLYPVASSKLVEEVERGLGFRLPAFLVELYLHVSNGGFGPGYGLIGLPGGHVDGPLGSIVEVYKDHRENDLGDDAWRWPAAILPIAHWGCAIYSCVDCGTPDGAVVAFDPGGRRAGEPMDGGFAQTHTTLRTWFEDWVNGVNLWARMFEEDVAGATYGKNPFTREPIRIPKMRLRRNPSS